MSQSGPSEQVWTQVLNKPNKCLIGWEIDWAKMLIILKKWEYFTVEVLMARMHLTIWRSNQLMVFWLVVLPWNLNSLIWLKLEMRLNDGWCMHDSKLLWTFMNVDHISLLEMALLAAFLTFAIYFPDNVSWSLTSTLSIWSALIYFFSIASIKLISIELSLNNVIETYERLPILQYGCTHRQPPLHPHSA